MHTYDFHISTIIIVPTCPSIWLETTSKKSLLWILLFQSLFSLFSLKFDDKFCDTSYNCFLSAWTAECSASQSWIMRAHPPKAGRRNRRTKHTTRFKVKRGKVSVAEPGGIKNPARLSTVRESSNSPTSNKTTTCRIYAITTWCHPHQEITTTEHSRGQDNVFDRSLVRGLLAISFISEYHVLYSFPSSEFKKAAKDFISRRRPSQGVKIQTENTRAMERLAATL